MRIVKRIPIDFHAVAAESGLRRGKLAFSDLWGWGVFNTQGVEDGPDFGTITPPKIAPHETLRIEGNDWVVEVKQ